MRAIMSATILVLSTVSVAAPAWSATAETAVGASERAEHKQWEADTVKWMAEHQQAATELSTLAQRLRGSEHALARYDAALTMHEKLLIGRAEEPAAVLARHMAMRSAHDDMRQTHAVLMVAVADLKRVVEMNDDSGMPKK